MPGKKEGPLAPPPSRQFLILGILENLVFLYRGTHKIRLISRFLVIVLFAAALPGAWAQQPASPTNGANSTNDAAQKPATTDPAEAKSDTAAKPPADPTSGAKKPSFPPEVNANGMPLYETIQEDWSSLQIGASHLDPEPPLVGETDDGDGFTRILVQMKWRPGDPLDVYVILPKGVKNPPAVLYLYNFKDDTDRFKNDGWCERVTSGGTAAVGFVSALSGHRFHGRPMEQWFVSELQESLGSTVHDVKFILDYLAQRGDIDMHRIGMFGQASGGTIALLAAAGDPRIKAVDALDPWGDWPVWLAKSPVANDDPRAANYSKPDFVKKVEPLDPVKWLPTLTSTHIRIQQVMDNEATPDACKDALRKAAPKNAKVLRFANMAELAKGTDQGRLFDWIKAELKALPAPGASTKASTVVTKLDSGTAKNQDNRLAH
jgi:hypothetical protein